MPESGGDGCGSERITGYPEVILHRAYEVALSETSAAQPEFANNIQNRIVPTTASLCP